MQGSEWNCEVIDLIIQDGWAQQDESFEGNLDEQTVV